MPLPGIAVALTGGFLTYLVAKISTGSNARTVRPEPVAPVPVPRKAPTREPPPAPVDVAPPPKTPPPPVDKSPSLPTPPAPVETAAPVERPPAVVKPAPVAVKEPPPAPVEVDRPPAPPPPPVDTSPALPTPPAKEWGATVDVPVGDKYREAAEQGMKAPSAPSAPAPSSSGPPAGFDATIASTLAPGVAANIAAKQYDFDRAALKRFQTAAGVASDGVYGNDTWGALLYFTSAAPRALYQPNFPTPYPWGKFVSGAPSAAEPPPAAIEQKPPPASPAAPADVQSAQVGPVPPPGFNPASAKKLAKQVAANIDSKGKASYSRTLLKQFQTAAGIASDGLYGGEARRALMFYGVARPPTAAFAPVAMPDAYVWATQAQAAS